MLSARVDGGAWADFDSCPTREGFLVVSDGGTCVAVWRNGAVLSFRPGKWPAKGAVGRGFSFLSHKMRQLRSSFASETMKRSTMMERTITVTGRGAIHVVLDVTRWKDSHFMSYRENQYT